MLREIALFGALVPSLLLYFLAAIVLFVVIDRLVLEDPGTGLWRPRSRDQAAYRRPGRDPGA